jgi:hypothetical protein
MTGQTLQHLFEGCSDTAAAFDLSQFLSHIEDQMHGVGGGQQLRERLQRKSPAAKRLQLETEADKIVQVRAYHRRLAMIALGLAFWLGRKEPQASAPRGLAAIVLVYNTFVAILLVASAVLSNVSAVALWPATGLHGALAAWCAWSLRTAGLRRSSADG